jgi:hypothetical protein
MDWIIFSYSLSASQKSSQRVTLWRRLQRLGAISPVGGIYVLPAQDACIEGFQWLAQELHRDNGEALLIYVDHIEGLTNEELVALFCEARNEDYGAIMAEAAEIDNEMQAARDEASIGSLQPKLTKLRRRLSETMRIDYFNCPEGMKVEKYLDQIGGALTAPEGATGEFALRSVADYRGRVWATRPRPHVDRLASVWFIRQFIDAEAVVEYTENPAAAAITFDTSQGEFTHHGNLCTFETMIQAFGLQQDTALALVAEVVHEIDLRDGRYTRPETTGIDATLQGWLLAGLSDAELELYGVGLFTGLYASFSYMMNTQKLEIDNDR